MADKEKKSKTEQIGKARAKRFNITQLVDISNNRENFISAQGVNISESGILVEADEDMEIHASAYFLLEYPGSDESFEIEGIVVRSEKKGKKFHIAMEFTFDFSEQKKEVKKFIKLI